MRGAKVQELLRSALHRLTLKLTAVCASGTNQGPFQRERKPGVFSAFRALNATSCNLRHAARSGGTPFIIVPAMRTDWTRQEIAAIYHQPLLDLLVRAQEEHR